MGSLLLTGGRIWQQIKENDTFQVEIMLHSARNASLGCSRMEGWGTRAHTCCLNLLPETDNTTKEILIHCPVQAAVSPKNFITNLNFCDCLLSAMMLNPCILHPLPLHYLLKHLHFYYFLFARISSSSE